MICTGLKSNIFKDKTFTQICEEVERATEMRYKNFPHEAIAIIDQVLQLGRQERKYPDAFWRTLPMEEHINSAKAHLTDYIYNNNPGEDHLAHALTRLAMAVSLRGE